MRDVVSRVHGHFLPPARRWRHRAGVAAVLGVLGALALVVFEPTPAAPTRIAVRVTCDLPGACDAARAVALDVWSEQQGAGLPLDVVVTRDGLARLTAAGFRPEVLVEDIDAVARAERARLRDPRAARPADWFAEYKDFAAISEHLRQLALQAPELVEMHAIGGSIEGRPLWALRIGGATTDATPMLVNGTLHAREWISAMVTTCVADRLVRGYATDPAIRAFVDRTELWIVPVANPDGYQHSWSTDRYWRKNRRDRHGTDLNRNFGVGWGGDGSSRARRSDVYRGEYAFSEPETAALRDLAKREQVALHVDFHSYGQLLLYPWSYTAAPVPDRARFAAIGDRMASAMFATHQTAYRLISGAELYRAGGTMSDWMWGEVGARSYTIELRPKGLRGAGGFVLPPAQIRPTCDEGLAAVLALRASQ